MFSKEIVTVIQKYQEDIKDSITDNIVCNLNGIIESLKDVKKHLSNKLYDITLSDTNEDDGDSILADIKALKQQITYLNDFKESILNIKNVDKEDLPLETIKSEESHEIFDKVNAYVVNDDICPCCNVKFVPHLIYYGEKRNSNIVDKSIEGYRCPACDKLFVIDDDILDLKTEDINVYFNTKYYNKILFHDAIVIFNINKCSKHKHKIEDMICELPIIQPSGEIIYTSVPIIYCRTCNRYVMLKSIYDKLNGIPACIIIDETHNGNGYTENDFMHGDKGGSKLYQYGYNVNCTDKLTVEQRHTILLTQLLTNNITKGEIYSTLDTNINSGIKRKDSKKDWSKAVAKWKEDREFVQNLDLEKGAQRVDINRLILKFVNNKR